MGTILIMECCTPSCVLDLSKKYKDSKRTQYFNFLTYIYFKRNLLYMLFKTRN